MSDDYQFITYKVVYYAERGEDDGFGMGNWGIVYESIPFPTRKEAEAKVSSWPKPKGYDLQRVRIAEEPLQEQ